MSLRDRLQLSSNTPSKTNSGQSKLPGTNSSTKPAPATPSVLDVAPFHKGERFEEIKTRVHGLLVDRLNLEPSQKVSQEDVCDAARQILESVLISERVPMSRNERDLMIQELQEEILGLGPLEPLLRDPSISDILVNGPKQIYVERGGKLLLTTVTFKDNAHLMHIIDRIVSSVGRRVDEKNPMVDSRMLDGSRFNAVIPPLAIDGPALSIRKFKQDAGTMDKLLQWGSMTPEMALTLESAVKARLNIVVSGGTGAGKTTLLNSLSALIPEDERIVTIEDSAELQLQQEHIVRLETRPPNIEGEGAITARELIVNCLRMRPDRIIVGECRSGEALDMLQAMNTGHDGSLTTLHANSPRDAISRIETMCMMNRNPLPEKTIRQQIASAVHIIVQASRLQDGSRRVTSISEIVGMEGQTILLQEIFRYSQFGIDEKGKVIGRHEACGVRPKFAEALKAHGIEIPQDIFLTSPSPDDSFSKEKLQDLLNQPEAANSLSSAKPTGVSGMMASQSSDFSSLTQSGLKDSLSKLAVAPPTDEQYLKDRLARKA